jgi:hypothetical protein
VKFSGYGPGIKGGPRKLRYDLGPGGGLLDDAAPKKRRGTSVHVQFRPYVSYQIAPSTAKKLKFKLRPKVGGVYISSWADQKKYMDHERHHGRDVGWKDT